MLTPLLQNQHHSNEPLFCQNLHSYFHSSGSFHLSPITTIFSLNPSLSSHSFSAEWIKGRGRKSRHALKAEQQALSTMQQQGNKLKADTENNSGNEFAAGHCANPRHSTANIYHPANKSWWGLNQRACQGGHQVVYKIGEEKANREENDECGGRGIGIRLQSCALSKTAPHLQHHVEEFLCKSYMQLHTTCMLTNTHLKFLCRLSVCVWFACIYCIFAYRRPNISILYPYMSKSSPFDLCLCRTLCLFHIKL